MSLLKVSALSISGLTLWLAPPFVFSRKIPLHNFMQGVALVSGFACCFEARRCALKVAKEAEFEAMKDAAVAADLVDEISTSVYVSEQQRRQEAEQILTASSRREQPNETELDSIRESLELLLNQTSNDSNELTVEYSLTQGVVRYQWPDATNPKGRDKTFSQFHIDPDGKKVWTKGDAPWPAYRIDEVVELLKTIPDSEPVVIPMLEGEDNVEIARRIRLAALTLQGSNWSDPEIQKMLEALRATGKNVSIAVIGDNDDTGIKKGKSVWLVARHLQFPCLIIDPTAIDVDIPEKGDIREFLQVMEADEFLIRVEAEIFKAANSSDSNNSVTSHPRTCKCVVCLSFSVVLMTTSQTQHRLQGKTSS